MSMTCGLSKAATKSKAKHMRKSGKKAHMKKGKKGHGWCAVSGKKRKSRRSRR